MIHSQQHQTGCWQRVNHKIKINVTLLLSHFSGTQKHRTRRHGEFTKRVFNNPTWSVGYTGNTRNDVPEPTNTNWMDKTLNTQTIREKDQTHLESNQQSTWGRNWVTGNTWGAKIQQNSPYSWQFPFIVTFYLTKKFISRINLHKTALNMLFHLSLVCLFQWSVICSAFCILLIF